MKKKKKFNLENFYQTELQSVGGMTHILIFNIFLLWDNIQTIQTIRKKGIGSKAFSWGPVPMSK